MADFMIDDFQDVVVSGVESVEDDRVTGAVMGWATGQVCLLYTSPSPRD